MKEKIDGNGYQNFRQIDIDLNKKNLASNLNLKNYYDKSRTGQPNSPNYFRNSPRRASLFN